MAEKANTAPQRIVVTGDERGLNLDLRELWAYRELLYFFVWREVKVRYKQTAIGIVWVLLQPLLTMLIFTLVFNYFLSIQPTGDVPYPVFILVAIIHWKYFSDAITRAGTSLVGNAQLVSKVYFPRLIMPLAAVVTPLVDFALAFLVLLVMMPLFGVWPDARIVFIIPLLAYAVLTALAVSLWLSALNVRYRDVNYVIPFLVQIWMYLTPVMYPIELVPERLRPLYSINPMVGVVEGARWSLLGTERVETLAIAIGLAGVMIVFVSGLVFFKRAERTFADVI
jgi:lipopolysaccharide transport system permease protein